MANISTIKIWIVYENYIDFTTVTSWNYIENQGLRRLTLFSPQSLHGKCLQIYGDSDVSCKSDISDKFHILQWKHLLDKIMFCRRSWISQELENVIYCFQCRSSLDWIMSVEKSSVHLLLFQENVKVWIIQIGFNQSFVFGNNLHCFSPRESSQRNGSV